jgi:hypothetical protein
MKTYREWRYSSTTPDLGTRWRWVICLGGPTKTCQDSWCSNWGSNTAPTKHMPTVVLLHQMLSLLRCYAMRLGR